MGTALAAVLRSQDYRILTTVARRSSRTRELCYQNELELRDSLAHVVAEADILMSLVTPGSALEVAESVRKSHLFEPDRPLVYIDGNSISPSSMRQIEQVFAGTNVEILDVAIHGLASRLKEQGTIFASGLQAEIVDVLFGRFVRVKLLGQVLGKASLQKMLLGSMSKGIIGLFLQAGLVAQEAGLCEEFLEDLHRYYPDLFAFVERSLPTYPQHAQRRSQEMGEWESTLSELQFRSNLASEFRLLFLKLGQSERLTDSVRHAGKQELPQLLDLIAQDNPLRVERSAVESFSLR